MRSSLYPDCTLDVSGLHRVFCLEHERPTFPRWLAGGARFVAGVAMSVAAPRVQSFRTMALMGVMMAGAGTVDSITANLLPITAKHFTSNITLIAFMVALNRICGFLVQPYAAWKSDRHRSPGGRRRPFLLISWPATLVSVGVLGALPFVVPSEFQHTLGIVAALFVANLAMQAFLDVCFGSGDPMYGDMFLSNDLGRANGVRLILSNVATIAMTSVFIPLADKNEFFPYLGAMLFVSLSWIITGFFLKEPVAEEIPPAGIYSPLKPLRELKDRRTASVALIATAVLVVLALTEMLHALFVTETLGFSKSVLGYTSTVGIALSLVCPYPLGLLIDRIGARPVLIFGFVTVALVEAAFVFWVNDLTSLYVCLILFKISWFFIHMPVVPLMFQNASAEKRGSVFAAVQMTRAAVTSGATIVAGYFVGLAGSYRVCYLIAGLICVVGLIGAWRLEPIRRTNVPVTG